MMYGAIEYENALTPRRGSRTPSVNVSDIESMMEQRQPTGSIATVMMFIRDSTATPLVIEGETNEGGVPNNAM